MARARNIKPGFFKNELLSDMPAEARLLFIGLWTLADREGRLEDRPRRIKMELFPCDSFDVESMLKSLSASGFIKRYESDGKAVISIVNFLKHQNPHGTEKDSDLPGEDGEYTVHERNNNGCVTGTKRKSNHKETLNNVNPPLDNALIPESLFTDSLIPDSPNPEEHITENPPESGKPDPCPHQEIVNLYHKHLPALARVKDITPKRQTALRARWRQHPRFQSLSWWDDYFTVVSQSDFLMGRLPGKTWQADFDFLINASKFQKIIEGGYQ